MFGLCYKRRIMASDVQAPASTVSGSIAPEKNAMRHAEYRTMWIAALLFFAAFYALLIPFPIHLKKCGLADWQIGTVMGAFGIATLIGRPPAGYVADRWGPRPVIWFGTAMLVGGAAGVPLTATPATLFVLRVAQSLGYVAFTTAATMLVAELVSPERRGSALAMFGVSVNLAMTMTPLLIGASLSRLTVNGALWLAATVAFGAGWLASQVRPLAVGGSSASDWRTAYVPPVILRGPMATAAILGVGFGTFLQFLPILAERRDAVSAGTCYAAYGAAIIFTRFITAARQNRGDRRHLLWPAFLCLSSGLCVLALAESAAGVLIGVIFVAVGSGVIHPGLIATAVEWMPDHQRARAVASIYLGFDLGIGLGVWLLTPIFARLGVERLFLTAGIVSACGVGIVAWFFLDPVRR